MIDLNSQFSAISISGEEARDFLQAQLAADVRALTPDRALVSALLDPQGRVLGLFVLIEQDDGILALAHPSLRDTLLERLQRFVFRARVKLAAQAVDVAGHFEGAEAHWPNLPTEAGRIAWPGGRTLSLGQEGDEPFDERWVADDIRHGLPWLDAQSSGQYVGQMLDLDLLGAINFKKGCYPGQEVVARVHFRGRIKRGLALVEAAALAVGDELQTPEGVAAGEIVRAADNHGQSIGLAVVHESRSDQAVEVRGRPARMTWLRPRV